MKRQDQRKSGGGSGKSTESSTTTNKPPEKPRDRRAGPALLGTAPLLPYQEKWVRDDSKLKIVVKARQTGYSFAAALRAVFKCLERKTTWIFLSKGERQSRLLMEKVQEHVQAIGSAAPLIEKEFDVGPTLASASEGPGHPEASGPALRGIIVKQLEVRFPNGSVIYGLPANPETARGFSGNVTLDEFAFHADADKIYTALYPTITRGYSLEVISTPNGQQGKFFELARQAGLIESPVSDPEASGRSPKRRTPDLGHRTSDSAWSPHRVTLLEAVAQGLKVDVEALRAGLDDDTWRQEYNCEFISTAAQWISPELWQSCVSSEASTELDVESRKLKVESPDLQLSTLNFGQLFAGWDIARRRDFSVIWLSELVGDVTWTRGVLTLKNLPTPDQLREARSLMPLLRRMAIDQSGMGLAIFEQLAREFPGKVEGVQFTQAKKEAMAVHVKDRMEKRLLRLPDNDECRQSFMSLKRAVTATGLVRFDAEHDTRYGHADHFWACALAEAAAEQPTANWGECAFLAGEPVARGMRERVL
jgi:phage FluMu gp28-like protein